VFLQKLGKRYRLYIWFKNIVGIAIGYSDFNANK
jgi:hypothetical protein